MNHASSALRRGWRISLATALSTILLAFSVQGAAPPTYSNPGFIGPTDSHVTLVAKTSKRSRGSSSAIFVSNIRFHTHKKYTRVVLDMPRKPVISESKNSTRQRTTFQLKRARLSKKARKRLTHKQFPPGIEIGEGSNQTVSVRLDLAVVGKYKFHTLKRPARFVVDLYYSHKKKSFPVSTAKSQPPRTRKTKREAPSEKAKTSPITSTDESSAVASSPSDAVQPKRQESIQIARTAPAPAKSFKELLVVIDPGHGGKDPGAIGAKGTREKEITLNIAKILKDQIQSRLKAKVLLTRSRDVFLNLEDRVAFANNKKADVFVSIHVNSHSMKSIRGLEVYHFGKASDPRALQVAARENGITLADNTPPWQFIIADKLNDQKIEESQTFAWTTRKTLLHTLKRQFSVKDHGVKTAPFYVLRFTTMPSILTEVAFVSNPTEEKRLRSKKYQKSLAEGMYKGIHAYLKTLYPGIS